MSEQTKSNVLNYLEQLGVSVTMLSRDNSTPARWDSPPETKTETYCEFEHVVTMGDTVILSALSMLSYPRYLRSLSRYTQPLSEVAFMASKGYAHLGDGRYCKKEHLQTRTVTIPQPKRWHYRVQITRANCEPFVTDYCGSINDYNHGQADLDVVTFLSCLTWHSDDVSTFEDFCSCFGYDTDSIKALRTFEAVRAEADALTRIFSEAERAHMAELLAKV